jgi:hypothetical protein
MNKSLGAARPPSATPPRQDQSNANFWGGDKRLVDATFSVHVGVWPFGVSNGRPDELSDPFRDVCSTVARTSPRSPDTGNPIAVTQGCSTDCRA